MKSYTLFDIIGPIMIGPSSSHTAGACRIGYTLHHIIKAPLKSVDFTLYGSFAKTYVGHGTDLALLGGILGFKPDDKRIVNAKEIARDSGLSFSFKPSSDETRHPNTVKINVITEDGKPWEAIGESIGGGKMQLIQINGIDIQFTGAYNTLITHHQDTPGMLAQITAVISKHAINIANMKLYRESRGLKAIGIIEMDEDIPKSAIEQLSVIDGVSYVTLIERIYE
ncbi:L-serine ammonia-lyase, iron-sulfur-dependent subunit beta [Fusibacter paucivorans]|uniref:L-serine deaminase n=1 Tax=Fusibacter paucivorans TaxID=76009 RepID=A0ABS5PS97_9FIRM|nr:L-serine ammonia-lyase, iron-sulfur-dependent subunit beta [Fusibacter paucivorans]MBS7528038.1 L-serine ammonia-lyase, iron-sulfur-dependent subunit beta [Fusibacter paucivorans]